jgi:hypothetical protein
MLYSLAIINMLRAHTYMHILSHNLAKLHLSNDFFIMLSTSSCSCEAGLFLIWCILLEGNGWSFEGVECYLLEYFTLNA